jgi:hypothetical protein
MRAAARLVDWAWAGATIQELFEMNEEIQRAYHAVTSRRIKVGQTQAIPNGGVSESV